MNTTTRDIRIMTSGAFTAAHLALIPSELEESIVSY